MGTEILLNGWCTLMCYYASSHFRSLSIGSELYQWAPEYCMSTWTHGVQQTTASFPSSPSNKSHSVLCSQSSVPPSMKLLPIFWTTMSILLHWPFGMPYIVFCCCCFSVTQLWPTLWDPMGRNISCFPILYHLTKLAQTHMWSFLPFWECFHKRLPIDWMPFLFQSYWPWFSG